MQTNVTPMRASQSEKRARQVNGAFRLARRGVQSHVSCPPSRGGPESRVVAVVHTALIARPGPSSNRRTVGSLPPRRDTDTHSAAAHVVRLMILRSACVLHDELRIASTAGVHCRLKQTAVPAAEEPAVASGALEDAPAIQDRHASVSDNRPKGVLVLSGKHHTNHHFGLLL